MYKKYTFVYSDDDDNDDIFIEKLLLNFLNFILLLFYFIYFKYTYTGEIYFNTYQKMRLKF